MGFANHIEQRRNITAGLQEIGDVPEVRDRLVLVSGEV